MPDKMKFQSHDLTAANIDKIAALFPNAITESKDAGGNLKRAVNFDMLRTLLGGDLIACFADKISDSVIKEIARRQPLRAVFRDSSLPTVRPKSTWRKFSSCLRPIRGSKYCNPGAYDG